MATPRLFAPKVLGAGRADGIDAVIVGPLDGATVTKGLFETFTFSAADTYPVKEDISGNTATITVE